MTINPQAYARAAYPSPVRNPNALPRLFTLHWDNHKVLSNRREKDEWHECWATLYPSGTVTLDNGMFYRNMGELRAAYEAMGECRVEMLDEQGEAHD